MSTIYLDHNILAIVAGKTRSTADQIQQCINKFRELQHQAVLSAWHIYELSKSTNEDYIQCYSELVDSINPIWMSNPDYVKSEEIKLFLSSEFPNAKLSPHSNPAFNLTLSQMWSTYSNEILVGETFQDSVNYYNNPINRKLIDAAVHSTPEVINVGRKAYKSGLVKENETIVDHEYFKNYVPSSPENEMLDYVLDNTQQVFEKCPSIAIEEVLRKIRISDNFKPKESDGVDLLHALVGLGYCDYFVTDDKRLAVHAKRAVTQAGLSCIVTRELSDITQVIN